ncbi:hypothetical protein GCM10022409_17450 [Hymenobacter glaciei]|uniref:TonB-dependent receptor plug domain-containing protein n=2 Tax=Hymenobacter glaciei TaxID=877209 RepID=A0ABP7TZH2_9BACT
MQGFYRLSRPEKAYLHLDKSVYTVGETMWFSASVVAADTHRPDTLSRVLHVELLAGNGRVVSRRELRLDGGRSHGAITLPDTLAPDTYQLRAYTGWMRNAGPEFFFSRRIQIWPAASLVGDSSPAQLRANAVAARRLSTTLSRAPDVQFFAEGGSLVAGLTNVVAFKATDYAGNGLDVQGQVLDAQDKPVATFRSSHLGMGSFSFAPVAGQRYHAVVAPGGVALQVPLPAVQQEGYTLHVVTLASAFLVTIQRHGGSSSTVSLLGQVRGQVAYMAHGELTAGHETYTTRIPTSQFPAGIVQFTLVDAQGQPLAERLAFAALNPNLRVTLTPDRASYGPRQPVRVHVAVADAAGQPVAMPLSLAVADAGAVDASAETIAANLLLTSDLAGYIENPGYYFQNPTPETAQHLDALLLTQGWRRFVWKQLLAGPLAAPEFGVERAIGIRGQVTQPSGKPVAGGTVTYLQTRPEKIYLSTRTNPEGRFLFTGLDQCNDTTRLTLQARTDRGKRNLLLSLDPGPPVPAGRLPVLPLQTPAALADAVQRSQAQHAAEIKLQFDTTHNVMLSNVQVNARRAVPTDSRRIYPLGSATVLRMDDYPTARNGSSTALQMLQGRVPGVSVTGVDPNIHVQIRGINSLSGSSEPLYLLDGVPITADALAYFPAADVETIEILKGGQAAIFGSRGSAGVIAVYTRRGSPNYSPSVEKAPGVLALRVPGYACAREFYAPRYDVATARRNLPDPRRSTLYWNPRVSTNAAGQADVTFFTADAVGQFRLSAEGISAAGQPAVGSGNLLVR